MQALTANIQELAQQSAADRREMQELPNKTKNSWTSSSRGEKFPVLVRAKMAMRQEEIKIRIRMTKEVLPTGIKCPIRVKWQTPLDPQRTPGSPNWKKS